MSKPNGFIEQLKTSLYILTSKTLLLESHSLYKHQMVYGNLVKPILGMLGWGFDEYGTNFVCFPLPVDNPLEKDAFMGGCELKCPHGYKVTAIVSSPHDPMDIRALHEKLAENKSEQNLVLLTDFIRIRLFDKKKVIFDHTLFELEVNEVWEKLEKTMDKTNFCTLHSNSTKSPTV